MDECCEEFEFPCGYGNVDRAKIVIEDMVTRYCSDKINELHRIRYAIVTAAGERDK